MGAQEVHLDFHSSLALLTVGFKDVSAFNVDFKRDPHDTASRGYCQIPPMSSDDVLDVRDIIVRE